MKKFILDRIEEGRVVLECEDGSMAGVSLDSLPKNVRKKLKDGDVLRFEENSCFLDKQETENRKKRIEKLMNELFTE